MGFFDKYPNTDFHEINMDWILAKIQALKDRVKRVEDAVHDIVVETPNDGKLTIKRNNTIVGDFTANQATDEDINIVVPENTSDLNNDSGFITSSDIPAQVNSDWNANSSVAQILNKPNLLTLNYIDIHDTPTTNGNIKLSTLNTTNQCVITALLLNQAFDCCLKPACWAEGGVLYWGLNCTYNVYPYQPISSPIDVRVFYFNY